MHAGAREVGQGGAVLGAAYKLRAGGRESEPARAGGGASHPPGRSPGADRDLPTRLPTGWEPRGRNASGPGCWISGHSSYTLNASTKAGELSAAEESIAPAALIPVGHTDDVSPTSAANGSSAGPGAGEGAAKPMSLPDPHLWLQVQHVASSDSSFPSRGVPWVEGSDDLLVRTGLEWLRDCATAHGGGTSVTAGLGVLLVFFLLPAFVWVRGRGRGRSREQGRGTVYPVFTTPMGSPIRSRGAESSPGAVAGSPSARSLSATPPFLHSPPLLDPEVRGKAKLLSEGDETTWRTLFDLVEPDKLHLVAAVAREMALLVSGNACCSGSVNGRALLSASPTECADTRLSRAARLGLHARVRKLRYTP